VQTPICPRAHKTKVLANEVGDPEGHRTTAIAAIARMRKDSRVTFESLEVFVAASSQPIDTAESGAPLARLSCWAD
jgi:hypothetical protein